MRKISIWVSLAIAFVGCRNHANEVIVKGEIEGLKSDTIYFYGMGALYDHTDTIITDKGDFSYALKPDTTSIAVLFFNHQTAYPVFLEKGNTIKIKGHADGLLEIKGNQMNEDFTKFQKELSGLGKPSKKMIEEKAEAYMLTHPSSFVSIYLLDKYFVQKETPDLVRIKSMIESMSGLLQDAPYIQELQKQIEQIENSGTQKMVPFFSLPNLKGEMISRNDKYANKYLIIHFWASWSDECRGDFAALRQINRTYAAEPKKTKPKKANEVVVPEKKGLGILGISFDIDKKTWKDATKKDTLTWEQVNDLQGFNSELAQQFGVLKLPTILLLSPEGRILRRDLSADSLNNALKGFLIEKR